MYLLHLSLVFSTSPPFISSVIFLFPTIPSYPLNARVLPAFYKFTGAEVFIFYSFIYFKYLEHGGYSINTCWMNKYWNVEQKMDSLETFNFLLHAKWNNNLHLVRKVDGREISYMLKVKHSLCRSEVIHGSHEPCFSICLSHIIIFLYY